MPVRVRAGSLAVVAGLLVVLTATAGMSAAFQAGSGDAPVATGHTAAQAAEPSGHPEASAASGDERAANPNRTAVLPPTHAVEPGDTMSGVAQRYGVTVPELARANATDHDVLRPGEQLVVPAEDLQDFTVPEEVAAAEVALEGLLRQAAAEFGLDPALVQAVAWRESRWRQRVVSNRGAIGVLQVRPPTAEALGERAGRDLDLYDVADNVTAGAAYLAELLDRYGGDVPAALAAYHQGPTSVAQRGRIPLTERYVSDVLSLRDRFAAPR